MVRVPCTSRATDNGVVVRPLREQQPLRQLLAVELEEDVLRLDVHEERDDAVDRTLRLVLRRLRGGGVRAPVTARRREAARSRCGFKNTTGLFGACRGVAASPRAARACAFLDGALNV